MSRPVGKHVRVDVRRPTARAICDRCGMYYNHPVLQWQYEWNGPRLFNKKILVCPSCWDKPQEQLRLIVLPADPVPIENPRPEWLTNADNGVIAPNAAMSVNGFTSPSNPGASYGGQSQWQINLQQLLTINPGDNTPELIGNMNGIAKAFTMGALKTNQQCAYASPSNSSYNTVGINWSALYTAQGAPALIGGAGTNIAQQVNTTQGYVTQTQYGYAMGNLTFTAPINTPFLASSSPSTTWAFQGSNDGFTWTNLATGTTVGTINETVTVNSPSFLSQATFGYHQLAITGDGTHNVYIAQIAMQALGPNIGDRSGVMG